MGFRPGTIVEVEGDEEGFENSWSEYKVLKVLPERQLRLESVEFCVDEEGREDEKLVEIKHVHLVRPTLEDDSQKVAFTDRHPGEWVDVWREGCWWRGVVARCLKDHFTVHFPGSKEDPYHIWQPPKAPHHYRARTAKDYNCHKKLWECIDPAWIEGLERPKPPSSPPAATMLPQRSRNKQILSPKAQSKSRSMSRAQHVKDAQHPSRLLSQGKKAYQDQGKDDVKQVAMVKVFKAGNQALPKQSLSASTAQNLQHVQLLEDGYMQSATGCQDAQARSSHDMDIVTSDTLDPQQLQDVPLPHQVEVASHQALQLLVPPPSKGIEHLQTEMAHGSSDPRFGASEAPLCCPTKLQAELASAPIQQQCDDPIVFAGLKTCLTGQQLDAASLQDAGSKVAPSHIGGSLAPRSDEVAGGIIKDNQLAIMAKPLSGNGSHEERHELGQQIQGADNSPAHGSQRKGQGVQSSHMVVDAQSKGMGKKLKPSLPKAAAFLRNGLSTAPRPSGVALVLEKKRSASQDSEAEDLPLKRLRRSSSSLSRHCVLCFDFLGSSLSSREFNLKIHELLPNSLEASVAEVNLHLGCSKGGWGYVCFTSEDEALLALERLKCLYVWRPNIPFPTPILVHRPRLTKHPWGKATIPPGHVTIVSTGHFMQPNDINFKLAQEWRLLESQIGDTKQQLLAEQQLELIEDMGAYFQQANISKPQGIPPPPSSLTSSQLWLKGLAPTEAAVEDVATAFCQWTGTGDQSMESNKSAIELLRDPVFGNYNGQALVQMKTEDQAQWVQADMNEMIFTLGHGPRPIQAIVAKPGGPHGGMGTLEGALQSVFGCQAKIGHKGEVDFACIPEPQTIEEGFAHNLRELMLSHVAQRQALKRQARAWRQHLHKEHRQICKEEFSKYTRTAQLCQSDVLQQHIEQKRPGSTQPKRSKIPDLSNVLVTSEDEAC